MATSEAQTAYLGSGGLILFNAATFYELLAPANSLPSLHQRYSQRGNWMATLREAFQDAWGINYQTVFTYALDVLDALSPDPVTERALAYLYAASEYVLQRAALLRHDLTGRIYHELLRVELRKAYATYYTGIPAAELLAWLAIDDTRARVADFACGSGALLVAAYHRKLALAHMRGYETPVPELHRVFLEEDIWAADAMAFAAHLGLVNLAMQEPTVTFRHSLVYHLQTDERGRLGSLDLLRGGDVEVQATLFGDSMGPTQQRLQQSEVMPVHVDRGSFQLVIMNPPFTHKQHVARVLNRGELRRLLSRVNPSLSPDAGLAIGFLQLADEYVAPEGRIALVLPSAVANRDAWLSARRLLLQHYEIEHLMISWIPGRPSFSENTELREMLLVARRTENARLPTLVTHFDEAFDILDARFFADQLHTFQRGEPANVRTAERAGHLLAGQTVKGETFAFPRRTLEQASDNWYRLLAYRNPELVKAVLHVRGDESFSPAPFDIKLRSPVVALSEVAPVGLFVKNVLSAGYRELERGPVAGGLPSLMTSDWGRISITPAECHWLVRDARLRAPERFTPGVGTLLVPRKLDAYSTMKVGAITSSENVTSNMWLPAKPNVPGLASDVAGRLIALWMHSTFGLLLLLAEREETRGAWMEWKTERMRHVRVLDIRRLSKDQIDELLGLWNGLADRDWERMVDQLDAASAGDHPRRMLDEGLASIVMESVPTRLNDLYSTLAAELRRLHSVMSGGRRRREEDEEEDAATTD